MGFYKVASVESLGTSNFVDGALRRTAASSGASASTTSNTTERPKSYYIDGARKIDIVAMLKAVGDKFDISKDPSDYIFEAIRANSVNVPNENHDAFHRDELLRFDARYASPFGNKVGMPVYMTYIGKPHMLNHQASNPKRARGVILDSHYNDDAAAFEFCTTCRHRTAEASGRDPSGIHCTKCGSVVKDEFVEILVAVDTKKDPALARGIQAGILDAGSMGCNCASTTCNVCHHVARTVDEFCLHIRAAAKGSFWMRRGSKFERVNDADVKALAKKAGYASVPGPRCGVAVSLTNGDTDFEVRRAFEYCQGVEFDEYSRVHRPADPKARTVEILKAAEAHDSLPTLEEETEQLIRRARLARLEDSMSKTATKADKTFYALRVNANNEDVHIAETLDGAKKIAGLGQRDRAEYTVIVAPSAHAALARVIRASIEQTAQYLPVEADVQFVVPDDVRVRLEQQNGAQTPGALVTVDEEGNPINPEDALPNAALPNALGAPPAPSIEDVTPDSVNPKDEEQSPEEFGMLPPGASSDGVSAVAESDEEEEAEMDKEQKYAAVYGDFEIEVFSDKAILNAPSGELFTIKTASPLERDDAKRAFGAEVIDSVLSNGLVRTAKKYEASFARIADATEGAMFAMKDGYPMMSGGALEGAMNEMAGEQRTPGDDVAVIGGATKPGEDDMAGEQRSMPANSIESRDTDMQDEAEASKPTQTATEGADDDMEDGRSEYSMKEDALEGAEFDKKVKTAAKVAEERVRKLYAARLEKAKADFAVEKATLERAVAERFARALKIAAKRSALNIENSPLKTCMVDSLTVARDLGRSASTGLPLEYAGVDEGLALHLVEAAWASSAAQEADALITRAAELMTYDPQYLVSAERDLAKQAAVIPPVIGEEQLAPSSETSQRAASLRKAANSGNLTLAPAMADTGTGSDKLSRIRDALGPTKVGRMLTEEFQPVN